MAPNRFPNELRRQLIERQFVLTFEVVTPKPSQSLTAIEEFGRAVAGEPRVAAVAVTDRVRSDEDSDPIDVAKLVACASGKQPLVHWAGKNRTPTDLADSLARAEDAGLENLLLLTGDKVHHSEPGEHVPYLDAVNSLVQARAALPDALLAVAVGGFKYREEELMNQLFKLSKKIRAGADVAIGQIGFDVAKHKELLDYARLRNFPIPILGSLMPLSVGIAERVQAGKIPGITVTDGLAAVARHEAQAADKGEGARLRRLALQIRGLELLGYAGAQITGVHSGAKLAHVLDGLECLRRDVPDLSSWRQAWEESLRLPDGSYASTAPDEAYYLESGESAAQASLGERLKFGAMDLIHHGFFERDAPGSGIFSQAAKAPALDPMLTVAEAATKKPLVGCQTCGFCRLPYTQYVCPETCPKGLANGPCGGTNHNRCEFGDRECIHNARYRIAKATGRLHELEEFLVPPVPDTRGTCSWTNHFNGREPQVIRLSPKRQQV